MSRRIRSPELLGAGGWIGVAAPLSLALLRGKVVVLHFFAFSNVACQRVVEELREVEARFASQAVVIGVHSPKFPREADHGALVRAVRRLRIRHPVLDDPDMITWQQYGVKGWPTLVVIDPLGYVAGALNGEGNQGVLLDLVTHLADEHAARGSLRAEPLTTLAPLQDDAIGVLSSPAKVATDRRGRVVVADTGHDRVLVVELAEDGQPREGAVRGRLTHVVGGFSRPHGVRLYGADLYVCDTGRDRVLRLDLSGPPRDGEAAGPGIGGLTRRTAGALDEIAADLSSPADVIADVDRSVVVAEAGRHRLWRAAGADGSSGPIAGGGYEGMVDGRSDRAELAQPSGLTRVGQGIAFVDADSSALRLLTNAGRVATLVGAGLFDWGRSEGRRGNGRLQHPLGVAASPDGRRLYVADSFNDRLAVHSSGRLATIPLRPPPGGADAALLCEPGGVDVLPDGRLLVADTGRHRVVVVDPATGAVWPVSIELASLGAGPAPAEEGRELTARNGEPLGVPFEVDLLGLPLDPERPAPVLITVDVEPPWLLDHGPREWEHSLPFGELPLTAGSVGAGVLQVTVSAALRGDGYVTEARSVRRHPLHVV
ncbi:MAG: thioredoxin-like domain-containing protein [Acidimicrobiales bacterium]